MIRGDVSLANKPDKVDEMQAAVDAKFFEDGNLPKRNLDQANAVATEAAADHRGLIDEIAWRGRNNKSGRDAEKEQAGARHVVPHR